MMPGSLGPGRGRPLAKSAGKRGRKTLPRTRRRPVAGGGERFEFAMRAINEGVYDWDVASGTIYYSEAVYTVLHMPRGVKTPEAWRKRIHPEDLGAYDAAPSARTLRGRGSGSRTRSEASSS